MPSWVDRARRRVQQQSGFGPQEIERRAQNLIVELQHTMGPYSIQLVPTEEKFDPTGADNTLRWGGKPPTVWY